MLSREQFLSQYPSISENMAVYSQDGEKLGHISYMDDDSFVIQKGFFFPKEFSARYDDIAEVRDSQIIMNRTRSELESWRDENYTGWSEYDRLHGEGRDTSWSDTSRTSTASTARTADSSFGTGSRHEENINIPVAEERLEAEKHYRQTGEVRLRKVVHSELKTITVPVNREEVIVERTPVNEFREAAPGETQFREESITVPVMEEEVEVRKRPVVKEEVHLRKDIRTEEKTLKGDVRSEEVEIDESGLKEKRRKAG